MTQAPARPAVVDGVDLDVVAAAVRACPGVDDLDAGPVTTRVATYLPGRTVDGLKLTADTLTVQIRGVWDVPAAEVGEQVRAAVGTLVAGRQIDIIVADLRLPPGYESAPEPPAAPPPAVTAAPEPRPFTSAAPEPAPTPPAQPPLPVPVDPPVMPDPPVSADPPVVVERTISITEKVVHDGDTSPKESPEQPPGAPDPTVEGSPVGWVTATVTPEAPIPPPPGDAPDASSSAPTIPTPADIPPHS